ncbi:BTAD domain-containing putative transcriptional regulator [Cryptosporangium phraense]|uniref:BTAD domain-containing putative transcriptional regulator n=1 Tax=Cryptosporangium phraense TaxID=2593070 RepID=UPI001F106FAD|nr:BTAD domain-containing putative transcriptional regulator [Cryptosporangium phraense]
MSRTRVLADYDLDSPVQLREADTLADPLTPMLVVGGALTAPERTHAVLTAGARVDIHGLLLGAWPPSRTLRVADDGTTTDPPGNAARPDRPAPVSDFGRLSTLTAEQFLDVLTTLAEAHSGEPPEAPRSVDSTSGPVTADRGTTPIAISHDGIHVVADPTDESDGAAPGIGAAPVTPSEPVPVPVTHGDGASISSRRPSPADASTSVTSTAVTSPAGPESEQPNSATDDEQHTDEQHDEEPHPAPLPSSDRGEAPGHHPPDSTLPLPITVLGGLQIGPPGTEIRGPIRSNSLQALVYLVVHDGHASLDALRADIASDAALSQSGQHIYSAVSDLRGMLDQAGGPAERIPPRRRRYELKRSTVTVDLWEMQAALTDATAAETTDTRIAALRRAVAYYTGPLVDGHEWEWIEPYREAVRRQAIDAYVALAETLTDGDPREALTVLLTAITHAPYNEELYRRAMTLYAQLGNAPAIRDLRRVLTRQLHDLDAAPSNQTSELADRLLAQLRPRPARPSRPTGTRRK